MSDKLSLAQFVSSTREKLGLSRLGLSLKSNLPLETINSIEDGIDLFLSSTVRQKLAKGLKLSLSEIKKLEKNINFKTVSKDELNLIRDRILLNEKDILCPICGEKLIVRTAKLYDLEDNLVLNAKARCPKCPFQLKSDD